MEIHGEYPGVEAIHSDWIATPMGDSAFPWISAQPLLEPLLNMHTASYMSVIHEINALREVS